MTIIFEDLNAGVRTISYGDRSDFNGIPASVEGNPVEQVTIHGSRTVSGSEYEYELMLVEELPPGESPFKRGATYKVTIEEV